ncbi:hypothetical protein CHCC20335_0274 [Bacillus paralicheniformis]|nr:hypothetical protein CHCC20335_0274 [Bacillus paralicheniformis]
MSFLFFPSLYSNLQISDSRRPKGSGKAPQKAQPILFVSSAYVSIPFFK